MSTVNAPSACGLRTSAQRTNATDKKPICFEKCIGCPDLGAVCPGPNLLVMQISDLRTWVKAWKDYFDLTIEQCAAIWNTPIGTVSRFLSTGETDFKYGTVRGIVFGIIQYGQPSDQQYGDSPCPATSAEIQSMIAKYEQQLSEKAEECAALASRKLERADEYAERMAEQRENYEKHLANREESIKYMRDLAEKRQRDLEKTEAVVANYLQRIDVKNKQLEERDAEIRHLNTEILRMSTSHTAEIKDLIDRILRMSDSHSAQLRALTQKLD